MIFTIKNGKFAGDNLLDIGENRILDLVFSFEKTFDDGDTFALSGDISSSLYGFTNNGGLKFARVEFPEVVSSEIKIIIKRNGETILSDTLNVDAINQSVAELPEVNVEANKMLAGITAINTKGQVVTGNISSQGAKTYTPSTNTQYITSGKYLSGNQTIKGDVNLKSDNIKKGVKIFNVTGNYQGESSGGNFAKVTAFQKYRDAFNAVSAIEVSGFGEAEFYGEYQDFSSWNGKYLATDINETDVNNQIFKHQTENKYFYRMYCEDNCSYFWVFDTGTAESSVYNTYFCGDETLTNGNFSSPYYDWQVSFGISFNQVQTFYPTQYQILEGVKANYQNGVWVITNENVSLNHFEREPIISGIYAYNGDKLIGDNISFHYEKWMPQDGLMMYLPCSDKGLVYDRVNKFYLSMFKRVQQNGIKLDNVSGSGCFTGVHNLTLPKSFTLSAKVAYTGNGSNPNMCVIDFGQLQTGGFGIRASKDGDGVKYGLRLGYDEGQRQIQGVPFGEQHTITFTFDGDNEQLKYCNAYLDGEHQREMYYDPGTFNNAITIDLLSRYQEGQGLFESFTGTLRDVFLYNRVLSEDEIKALVSGGGNSKIFAASLETDFEAAGGELIKNTGWSMGTLSGERCAVNNSGSGDGIYYNLTSPIKGNTPVSVSMKLYIPSNLNNDIALFYMGNNSMYENFGFEIATDGKIHTAWGDDITYNVEYNPLEKANSWFTFTATYDGRIIKLYKDAALVSTSNPVTLNINRGFSDADLVIGSRQNDGRVFKGGIKDVKVYNYCLSADEVSTLI